MDVTMFEVENIDTRAYEGDGDVKAFYVVEITGNKGGVITIHSHEPEKLIHLLELCIRNLGQLKEAYNG